MFFSKNRLKNKNDINNILKTGRIIAGNFVFLKFLKNKSKTIRFSVIVGKRVSKSAVLRNKIKRQLREAIRKNILKIKPSIDFLAVAKSEIVGAKYNRMENDLLGLFSKLNQWRKQF